MARYFFDLHAEGPAQWDHAGTECAERADIENHARTLLAAAARREGRDATITLCVHEGSRGVVLTALAKPGADVELVWTSLTADGLESRTACNNRTTNT